MTQVEGIEVYRTNELWSNATEFKLVARTVQLLGHLPVVQKDGNATVLYALAPELLKKRRVKLADPQSSPTESDV